MAGFLIDNFVNVEANTIVLYEDVKVVFNAFRKYGNVYCIIFFANGMNYSVFDQWLQNKARDQAVFNAVCHEIANLKLTCVTQSLYATVVFQAADLAFQCDKFLFADKGGL